jgi:hypothetical protein
MSTMSENLSRLAGWSAFSGNSNVFLEQTVHYAYTHHNPYVAFINWDIITILSSRLIGRMKGYSRALLTKRGLTPSPRRFY